MIRILLADDHPLILRGVSELLDSLDDMEVVGREVRSDSAVAEVARLEPDVFVQDLAMQGEMTGIDVIRYVSQNHPATRIVVLTMHASVASAWEALQHGASAYVTKLGDFDDLVAAIYAVTGGQSYVGSPLDEEAVNEYARLMEERGMSSLAALTRRELEVLKMVAHGFTSSEIADHLHIGRRTVESHRANVSSKLGLRNQAEVIRFALERGLAPEGPAVRSAIGDRRVS